MLSRIVIYVGFFFMGILLLPGLPPDLVFVSRSFESVPWTDGLAHNDKMAFRQKLSERTYGTQFDKMKGPETLAIRDGYIYTGIVGGDIIRLNLDEAEKGVWEVVSRGTKCAGQFQEMICGKPLGLDFDSVNGNLIVADGTFGLYEVNVETKMRRMLVPATLLLNNEPNLMMNSVAVAKDGTIYYTVSSTKFRLNDGFYEFLSSGSGRLMSFDQKTNISKILAENLAFLNGLAISGNEDYLLMTEPPENRVWKYHLQGVMAGKAAVLMVTPGINANIRRHTEDTFFIAVEVPILPNHVSLFQHIIQPSPLLSRFIVRLLYWLQNLFKWLNNEIIEAETFEKAIYWIGHFEPFLPLGNTYGLLLEVDGRTGNILKSWHDSSGTYGFVSEGLRHKDWIYLGSFLNVGVERVKYN